MVLKYLNFLKISLNTKTKRDFMFQWQMRLRKIAEFLVWTQKIGRILGLESENWQNSVQKIGDWRLGPGYLCLDSLFKWNARHSLDT